MSSVLQSTFILCVVFYIPIQCFRCDRRPYGSNTPSSAADGRFKLQIIGDHNAYLPDQIYTLQLTELDGKSKFTAFMISAEGDTKPDPRNPRRMITQHPGQIRPQSHTTAKYSDRCSYSVEQVGSSLKSSVEVYWEAPSSGSGCVTLRAMVAENEDMWFEDGTPLTLKVCEDMRQPDDVAPQLNDECGICDEAKYEVSFSGMWSRNTHPVNYPENDWVPRYSDLVGASHTSDFILWVPGVEGTDGLRQLAEHANSSKLEVEILEKVGSGVRTLIKGKGHSNFKMTLPTHSIFRADKENHLLSVAIGIFPSPDWFLGVSRFELCQLDNTWLQQRELNLLPWDAGTDSGVSYESPNIQTFPQDAVTRVQMNSYDKNSPFFGIDIKDVHPFGRLKINLIKIYHRECEEATESDGGEVTEKVIKEDDKEDENKGGEPEEPSRYQNPDIASSDSGGSLEPDPASSEECPMTAWQEWSNCEGICISGKIKGIKWRERYHLVDGVPIEKYDPTVKVKHITNQEVSKYCKDNYDDFEQTFCEEKCPEPMDDDDLMAEHRVMEPMVPGQDWSRKRALPKIVKKQ